MQTAENARSSPDEVFIKIAGRFPNLKIRPEFGANSSGDRSSVTEFAAASAAAGGMR